MKLFSLILPFFSCVLLAGAVRAEVPAGLVDPAWTQGELPNGLRYFIRPNARPENRLELRLVVNAGSVLEDDDQQGLAHYLEHVAFNGTENFERNEMVRFLESLGVGFGPDLNAYTSFDETVYMLRLPTDQPEVVAKGFLILSDWAGRITMSDEAIEQERGIIIEEWRGRRGGSQRIRDLKFPVLFAGSRYAERLPIGILEVLEDFDFDRLRQFFFDWYRPDLISVVAVGDLEVEEIRGLIHQNFADLAMPENPRERPEFRHPLPGETRAGVFHDPELTSSTISLFWMMPYRPVLNEDDHRLDILEGLVTDMLNQRFSERMQQPDAPFLRASTFHGTYTRGGNAFLLFAQVDDAEGAHETAMRALLSEAESARQYGFTDAEIQRAVRRRLRAVERMVQERDTVDHVTHVREMVAHALEGLFVPGVDRDREIHLEVLAAVDPQQLQAILEGWMAAPDRVVLADGPSRDGRHALPEEAALLAVFEDVAGFELQPREEREVAETLVATPPEPGTRVSVETDEALGLETWVLSNGVRVMFKPTAFQRDQILLSAWAPGGHHGRPLADLPHARMADQAVAVSGLGTFSAVDLRNALTGRLVSLSPSLTGEQASLNGSASPQDLETLFELIYLHFTAPRVDVPAFEAHRRRVLQQVRNRLADPREVFYDTVSRTMTQHHPRLLPVTEMDVLGVDAHRAVEIFSEHFSNAAGFTFLFVGNIDPEAAEPLILKWLGGLPSTGEVPQRTPLAVEVPRHELRRTLRLGLEPISQVRMMWTSDDLVFDYPTRHAIQSMIGALQIRAREVLREEMSGTYHVSVWPSITAEPTPRVQLNVFFGCDPTQVEVLIARTRELIEEFTTELLADSYIQTVQETQRRRREVDLQRNEFWNSVIPFYEWHGEPQRTVMDLEPLVAALTAEQIRDTAARFFRVPDQAIFILMPGADAQSAGE